MYSLFLTGTDTAVGKTRIACALLRGFASRGLRAIGMKPVASGIADHEECNADVSALIQASNVSAPIDLVNPFSFAAPIAPHLAAADDGRAIDLEIIANAYAQLAARADAIVVEGAGGALTPLSDRIDILDIPLRLQLPVLLVVGMRLGCISHTLLTVAAIAARGVRLTGWIANRIDPAMLAADANVATLVSRIPAPLIAEVAWNDERAIALHAC